MKKIFSLIFILSSIVVFSQGVLDSSYLKCQYEYTLQSDTLSGKTRDDLLILQIGENISKCYSYYTFQTDSLVKTPDGDKVWKEIFNKALQERRKHRDSARFLNSFPHNRSTTYVYKNYPEGSMTITDRIGSDRVIYEDTLNAQNWQITDSVKTVLGYECQQATCDFRGRQWTAWFTTDIPVSDGPWKLSGLPGLIMKAYDKGNQYVFTIVGLEKVEDEPIFFSETYVGSKRFEKSNRIDFLKAKKKYLMDMNGYIEMETGIDLSGGNPPKIMRYDLLELDYKQYK